MLQEQKNKIITLPKGAPAKAKKQPDKLTILLYIFVTTLAMGYIMALVRSMTMDGVMVAYYVKRLSENTLSVQMNDLESQRLDLPTAQSVAKIVDDIKGMVGSVWVKRNDKLDTIVVKKDGGDVFTDYANTKNIPPPAKIIPSATPVKVAAVISPTQSASSAAALALTPTQSASPSAQLTPASAVTGIQSVSASGSASLVVTPGPDDLVDIGDLIWLDDSPQGKTGMQDGSEVPFTRATVPLSLYTEGRLTPLRELKVKTGKYAFEKVPQGTYKVCITVPEGYKIVDTALETFSFGTNWNRGVKVGDGTGQICTPQTKVAYDPAQKAITALGMFDFGLQSMSPDVCTGITVGASAKNDGYVATCKPISGATRYEFQWNRAGLDNYTDIVSSSSVNISSAFDPGYGEYEARCRGCFDETEKSCTNWEAISKACVTDLTITPPTVACGQACGDEIGICGSGLTCNSTTGLCEQKDTNSSNVCEPQIICPSLSIQCQDGTNQKAVIKWSGAGYAKDRAYSVETYTQTADGGYELADTSFQTPASNSDSHTFSTRTSSKKQVKRVVVKPQDSNGKIVESLACPGTQGLAVDMCEVTRDIKIKPEAFCKNGKQISIGITPTFDGGEVQNQGKPDSSGYYTIKLASDEKVKVSLKYHQASLRLQEKSKDEYSFAEVSGGAGSFTSTFGFEDEALCQEAAQAKAYTFTPQLSCEDPNKKADTTQVIIEYKSQSDTAWSRLIASTPNTLTLLKNTDKGYIRASAAGVAMGVQIDALPSGLALEKNDQGGQMVVFDTYLNEGSFVLPYRVPSNICVAPVIATPSRDPFDPRTITTTHHLTYIQAESPDTYLIHGSMTYQNASKYDVSDVVFTTRFAPSELTEIVGVTGGAIITDSKEVSLKYRKLSPGERQGYAYAVRVKKPTLDQFCSLSAGYATVDAASVALPEGESCTPADEIRIHTVLTDVIPTIHPGLHTAQTVAARAPSSQKFSTPTTPVQTSQSTIAIGTIGAGVGILFAALALEEMRAQFGSLYGSHRRRDDD